MNKLQLVINRIFLSEKIIIAVIILNSFLIFLQESGFNPLFIQILDVLCTVFFIIEMTVKHIENGFLAYWKNGWDRFDGVLVILSIPSLLFFILPAELTQMSNLLVLRMLRIIRFFRVIHLFPDFKNIVRNIRLAFRQSVSVLVCFTIILILFSMINCSLFGQAAPQYFNTPLNSLYSCFRICTVEGWYEIPDAITAGMSSGWIHIVRLYFCILLFGGGIIGLSIVNSIFVDAMVSDNNDEVLLKLQQLEDMIKQMQQKQ